MKKLFTLLFFFAIIVSLIAPVYGGQSCVVQSTPKDISFACNTSTGESKTYIDVNHSFTYHEGAAIAVNERFDIVTGTYDNLKWYNYKGDGQWDGHKIVCDSTTDCCNLSESLLAVSGRPSGGCQCTNSDYYPVHSKSYDIHWCDFNGDSNYSDDILVSGKSYEDINSSYYPGTWTNNWYVATLNNSVWNQKTTLESEESCYALIVYNNKLYGGTGQNGKLYEWNGENSWIEQAATLGAETYIYSLAVYNDKLYGGTAPNGKLYEWNDIDAWVEKAPKLGAETYIYSLAVYNDKLYGGTAPNGKLYEWNGVAAWVEKAPKLGAETYIYSLAVYNGKLYGGTYPNGKLYEWNGVDAWVERAPILGTETSIRSLAVYNNKLYGGTAPNGKLYEWNGVDAWVEKAPKLGTETYINSLAVYNSKLYGGTYPNDKLYEWNGVDAWVEKAPRIKPGDEEYIYSLVVYNGKLYGSTDGNCLLYEWNGVDKWISNMAQRYYLFYYYFSSMLYRLVTYNNKLYATDYHNGQLLEWNGGNGWIERANLVESEEFYTLAVYNDKLYGGTAPNGKLYEWNGVDAWVEKAPKLGTETDIYSLAVYNDKLYGGTAPNGKLYEWNGVDAWVEKAPKLGAETYIDSLTVYNGKLYGGTYPNGKLYEWNGVDAWVEKAPKLGTETDIYSLAVYNDKLYGGTAPNGKLYEWNDIDAWVEKAPKLGTETRIYSLSVYNNKLYGGTYPNGYVYEWNGIDAWIASTPVNGYSINDLEVYNNKLYAATDLDYYGYLYDLSITNITAGNYWWNITEIEDAANCILYPVDTNNDGKTELAYACNLSQDIGLLTWNISIRDFDIEIFDSEMPYGNITALDIDGDNDKDIVVEGIYDNSSYVILYRNMGIGNPWIKCYIDTYPNHIDFNRGDLIGIESPEEELFVNDGLNLYIYDLTVWNATCPVFDKIQIWSSGDINMRFNIYDVDANGFGDIFGIFDDKATLLLQESELTFNVMHLDDPGATFDDVAIIPYDNGANCKLLCMDNDYLIVEYDIFGSAGCVNIQGYTWNAINETLINSTDVSWKQNSTFWNDSPSSGFYQVFSLNASCCSYLNASSTNYNTYSTYFYPFVCGLYEVNAYMIPTNFSYNNHAIAGVITQLPYQDSLANATVNISNSTWSANTTTNSMGYYIFDSLSSGNYTINASKTGYFPEQDKTVHTGSYTIHNIMMSPEYEIKVEARDAVTRAPINNWWLEIKEVGIDCVPSYGVNQLWNVSNWTINVTLPYGYFSFTGSHPDYYPNTTYQFVWQNDTLILYLDKAPTKFYPYHEHIVEFRVLNVYGKPYSNVRVNITPTESTLSSWDGIWEFFGITKKDAPLLNGSMTGTTDSGGRISFMMAEIIKYKIEFTKDSDNINETHYIYPKEFQYTIILIGAKQPTLYESVEWNLTAVDINASFTNLGLTYSDGLNETTNVYFYISDSNDNIIYQSNTSSSTVTEGCPIAHEKGVSYYWGFRAQHETFGEIRQDKVITFKCRLIDLELDNESYYTWIAIALIVMITTLFSAATVKLGTIIVPFMGGFFNWIGWLAITPVVISCVIIIGVLLYLQKSEHDKRY